MRGGRSAGRWPLLGRGAVWLWLAGWAITATPATFAAVLTRGPLLQNPDNDPTSVTILWWTDVAGDSTVEYGTTTALGQTTTAAQATVCEVGSAGTCHSVRLTSLQPGTRYYYQLSTNGTILQPVSLDTYFTTLQAASSSSDLFFTVVGDWGSGASAYYDVANNQNAADPPLIFTVGDNAYQNGTQSDWDNNALPAYSVLLRRALFFPVLGNHDLNSVGASNWASSAQIRMLALPRNAPTGQEERYWAVESGNVLFLGLDSNSPALNSTQRAWLEQQLATTTRKWKFVFLHHTPYSCANGLASIGSDLTVRTQWGPLFESYGVDVVFTGHDHIYERSQYWDEFLPDGSPGQDGKGTVYIMTGGGGATLDSAALVDANGPYRQPLFGSKTYCPWLAQSCPGGPSNYCSFARYQHMAVRITGDETLTVEAVDRNNVVFDTFVVVKPNPTATGTATPTSTSTPALTPTPSPSFTPPPSATPTTTATYTATSTSTSTATLAPSTSPTRSPTHTPSATTTATSVPTPTPTPTLTASSSPSPTVSPSATPSPTPTLPPSNTPTSSSTATLTPTATNSTTATPTSSPTATHTPSPTRTATPTPPPSHSPTPTTSATPTATWPPPLCTQAAPENSCAPGGGSRSKDCLLEFHLPEPASRNRQGVPRNRIVCTDGDPHCDADGDSTNGVCAIPLQLCLNNLDPRLPKCFASGVSLVDIRQPGGRTWDSWDTANLQALAALLGPGANGFGLTLYQSGVLSQLGQPVLAANRCSGAMHFFVPVRAVGGQHAPGTRRLRILVAGANGAIDFDSLRAECRPAP